MVSSNTIAAIPAAMGDPVRMNMLMSLRLDGALTAGELAAVGNVAPSTASEHLARMMDAGLVVRQKSGRKRLYSLADADVCDLLDVLLALAEQRRDDHAGTVSLPEGVLHARLCYDHLAGRLGCAVSHALFARDVVRHGANGPQLTEHGQAWLSGFGIDARELLDAPRCAVRLCQDWTEKSHHLGGSVASSLLAAFRERDWVRTARGRPEVFVTPLGVTGFRDALGLDLRAAGR